jgi:hypothetical protein
MYIYLIESLETGQFKIGLSKNPNKRINTLQTGNGGELKLIYTFKTNYPNKLERYLHNIFSHENTIGEWFNFSHSSIVELKKECYKMEKNYDYLNKSIDF